MCMEKGCQKNAAAGKWSVVGGSARFGVMGVVIVELDRVLGQMKINECGCHPLFCSGATKRTSTECDSARSSRLSTLSQDQDFISFPHLAPPLEIPFGKDSALRSSDSVFSSQLTDDQGRATILRYQHLYALHVAFHSPHW